MSDREMEISFWRRTLGFLAAFFLGAILLVAGYAKFIEPGAFVQQIRLEELDTFLSAPLVALIALGLEILLGLLLVLGVRQRVVLWATSALVAFFIFLTGRNYWLVSQGLRDPDASCGCFGSLIERTPAEAFFQDLFLLIPPLLITLWATRGGERRLPAIRTAIGAMGALAVVLLTATSAELKYSEAAAAIASASLDSNYRLTATYQLRADGQPVGESQIYDSEAAPSLVVSTADLRAPVVIDPRTGNYLQLELEQVKKLSDGTLQLPAELDTKKGQPFEIGDGGIVFEVEGRRFVLVPSG